MTLDFLPRHHRTPLMCPGKPPSEWDFWYRYRYSTSGQEHWKYFQAKVEETYAQWDIENTSCDGGIYGKINKSVSASTVLVPGKMHSTVPYRYQKTGGWA